MDHELLKKRIKKHVRQVRQEEGALWYACDHDGFEFSVPPEDQQNAQGAAPIFKEVDKGIYFMRWIRKAMAAAS